MFIEASRDIRFKTTNFSVETGLPKPATDQEVLSRIIRLEFAESSKLVNLEEAEKLSAIVNKLVPDKKKNTIVAEIWNSPQALSSLLIKNVIADDGITWQQKSWIVNFLRGSFDPHKYMEKYFSITREASQDHIETWRILDLWKKLTNSLQQEQLSSHLHRSRQK